MYEELGATATDNYKEAKALTTTIIKTAFGPLLRMLKLVQAIPVYPRWYMENLEYQAARIINPGPYPPPENRLTIDQANVKDGSEYALKQLSDCKEEDYPDNCGFVWDLTCDHDMA